MAFNGSGGLTTAPLGTGSEKSSTNAKCILYQQNQPVYSVSAPITISSSGATDITLMVRCGSIYEGDQFLPTCCLGGRLKLASGTSTVSIVEILADYSPPWTTLASSSATTLTPGSTYTVLVTFNSYLGIVTVYIDGTLAVTFTLLATDLATFTTPENTCCCGIEVPVNLGGDDGETTIGTFTAVAA